MPPHPPPRRLHLHPALWAQDLRHFGEMEKALGVAVGEYATLASARAKVHRRCRTKLQTMSSLQPLYTSLYPSPTQPNLTHLSPTPFHTSSNHKHKPNPPLPNSTSRTATATGSKPVTHPPQPHPILFTAPLQPLQRRSHRSANLEAVPLMSRCLDRAHRTLCGHAHRAQACSFSRIAEMSLRLPTTRARDTAWWRAAQALQCSASY